MFPFIELGYIKIQHNLVEI